MLSLEPEQLTEVQGFVYEEKFRQIFEGMERVSTLTEPAPSSTYNYTMNQGGQREELRTRFGAYGDCVYT